MANVKISQLPSLSTMTDLAQIPVVAGGTTYQITGANLSSYFSTSSAGSKIVNGSTEANIGVAGGNANISVGGISNVAVFTQSGVIVSGVLTAPVLTTNNIRSDDSSFVNIEDGVNVTGAVVASGNITGGNVNTGVITLTNGAVIKDNAGDSVAFGQSAGGTSQGNSSVALGQNAGATGQGTFAVAIGRNAGQNTQGGGTVAVGVSAGGETQGNNAIAIGSSAGFTGQGSYAVGIGIGAGQTNQGVDAVAIGNSAGSLTQGISAVAIGTLAGRTFQANNSIIINATGANLDQTTANTFTVAPVRNDVANTANVMFYNATSNEITYGNTINVAGNIGAGNVNVTTATGNLVFGRASATGSPGINSTSSVTVVSDRFGTPKEWVFGTDGSFTGLGNIAGGNVNTGAVANTGNLSLTSGANSWTFDTTGNLTVPSCIILPPNALITSVGASPAPRLNNFDSVSAVNLSASGNVTSVTVSASGNITGARFYGDVGNVTYQQTTVYYVDPLRTANYTPTGTIIKPYANVTAAIAAAVAAGITDANPATVMLLNNTTENITMAPGVYLTSPGTGTHGSPVITGVVTVTSSTGTLSSNHYSISNLRIVAPTNGHGINFTGSAAQKLFMRDMWIDASGTGDCIYMDNSNATSTVQFDVGHLTHSGSGDIYCINVTAGNCYVTDIETSGATQVAAVQNGAVLTIDGSELDANGDVVCETYGTGSLTITNSILTNTATNGNGIKINSAGSTVTVGQCLFSIPVGTGSVVYYNPAATLLGSNIAFASISFFPGTNTTIDARLLPIPLAVAVGTIASPILYGDITTSTLAQDWDLLDNNASALSFDTTGKAGVLELVTTNAAEGVKMSGFASAVGNITGGNLNAAGLSLSGNVVSALNASSSIAAGTTISAVGNITGGNILTGGLISATSNITGGNITSGGSVSFTGLLSFSGGGVNNQLFATNLTTGTITIGGTAQTGFTQIGRSTVTSGLYLANGVMASGNTKTVSIGENGAAGSTTTIAIGPATATTAAGTATFNTATTVSIANTSGAALSVAGNITGGNLITGALTSTASLSVTGNTATITTANYSVGYLTIPQISFAANATAALVDSGKHYYTTSASNLALTLADNSAVSWPVGTALSIVNRGTANVTVAPAAGVSLYLAGNSTSANRVVTTYGMATVMNVAANVWMINGTVV